jgi:hypothetical protein
VSDLQNQYWHIPHSGKVRTLAANQTDSAGLVPNQELP